MFSPPFVLLENRLQPDVDAQLFSDPVDVVVCHDPATLGQSWDRVEEGLSRGLYAAGFFSFELGYCSEPLLRPLLPAHRRTPLFWLGLFASVELIRQRVLDEAFAALGLPLPLSHVEAAMDVAAYTDRLRQILAKIAAGEVYQVNLTFPMEFRYAGDPLRLYAALRTSQPVAHGAMIGLPDRSILSVSPELFVSVCDGHAVARPMKGTAPRGVTGADDERAAARLVADPKQRAENLMIVDLLRNDLARISEPGSVSVPQLFSVETFPTLHTMTSTVTGRLRADTALRDLVRALFPCGSVVGAPKHRGMQLIRALEETARDVYTGAIGAIHPDGDLELNVAIRTAAIDRNGDGRYGVGGGIVADSVPQAEWEECLLKARVLTDLAQEYGLIETLRWSHEAGFCRLALHLDRLARSAVSLGFDFDRLDAQERFTHAVRDLAPDTHRIRLELSRDGSMQITTAILAPPTDKILTVAVSPIRLDAGDPFLRHKTTRRYHYDAAFATAAASGANEALMVNNYGDIADASRNSVFVERDGMLLTPPLTSGALAGVLRRSLLDAGKAYECRLVPADLAAAPCWYLGNSLFGLREARLVDGTMP